MLRQVALALIITAVASVTASAQSSTFSAAVIVDEAVKATATLGQFTSSSAIDFNAEAVTLTIAGTNSFSYTFPAGSLEKGPLGSYTGKATPGSQKIGILLHGLRGGHWVYSAAIEDFVPGSNSVTVTLTIGAQSESATVKPLVFP